MIISEKPESQECCVATYAITKFFYTVANDNDHPVPGTCVRPEQTNDPGGMAPGNYIDVPREIQGRRRRRTLPSRRARRRWRRRQRPMTGGGGGSGDGGSGGGGGGGGREVVKVFIVRALPWL